ncbi:structure-specific endonuclease subunit slx1 [Bacillus rossius redtenbacheri]|uniref:structure-specific endonuclease subunit slx1 n=1 Tax=Bacillus rossius redtenbacheri TaxID=93214 RepID=UPI002FDD942F
MDNEIAGTRTFFGVYLLFCTNIKYKGRTYIGYTVNPNRRIKQHNKGKKSGGAWRTSNKGPWEMVLIIHGFPNDISALRFEWAWQHPYRSRRLKHISKKKPNEKMYDFCFRILTEMLQVGPWNRLPLTIQWLKQEYARDFPVNGLPPLHMAIAFGPLSDFEDDSSSTSSVSSDCDAVVSELKKKENKNEVGHECYLCNKINIQKYAVTCPICAVFMHIICVADVFLHNEDLIPVSGNCPACKAIVLWRDLVQNKALFS